MKPLLTILIFVFCAVSALSQPKQSVLFDDFGKMSDEEFNVRVMVFYFRGINTDSGRGLVEISAPPENPELRILLKWRVLLHAESLQVDETLLSFAFTKGNGTLRVRFWLVQADGASPELAAKTDEFSLDGISKTFTAFQTCRDEDEFGLYPSMTCYAAERMPDYARLINANPELESRIVISEKSVQAFRRKMFGFIRELSKRHGVEKGRVRFVRNPRGRAGDIKLMIAPRNLEKKPE